jgi:endonuclease/exonuclease/phosphatase family metal-dependent hydrolase
LEFTPDGARHWTYAKYWRKLNHIGQAILSCCDELPDLVALVEVENDTVLHDLTRRSLLRNAGYEYLMTSSPDIRGIDVALLYQPSSFRPVCYEAVSVPLLKGMRPTRDILYIRGEVITGDTLHVFVVHAPSRFGGERESRPYRMQVAKALAEAVGRIQHVFPQAGIIVAGDFNATLDNHSLRYVQSCGLVSATKDVRGIHGVQSNYCYQGVWEQIDHVFVSHGLSSRVSSSYINDAPFLLEEDTRFGGMKPFRTFNGYRYQSGFSDHLPLIVRFVW